jgi:Na+-transporting methylmalonyl-CoA/oxaloacetate decarboxylase gamma subunit
MSVFVSTRRVALVLLACATAGLSACAKQAASDEKEEAKAEAKGVAPFAIDHEADGTTVVVATDAACQAAGIEVGVATPRDVASIALAHGVLREDPSRVAVVRAPFGGELAAGDVAWPELGAPVFHGNGAVAVVLARLLPRAQPLTPAERADLQAKLADAAATKTAIDAELVATRAELARVKALNAEEKGASDRAVEAAALAVTAGEAKLRGADESFAIYTRLLAAPLAPLAPVALKLARGDTVLFVGARIGESVEAGQELLRVADLGVLLATVTLPAGPDLDAVKQKLPPFSFASATVRADDGTSAAATILGPAPDSAAIGRTFLLRVDVGDRPLRPGQSIVAELARTGAPLHVLALPEAALVRYAGQSWIYVAAAAGGGGARRFARTAVTVDRFVDGAAILGGTTVKGDTQVVRAGAASLLSQEQLQAGGGGE